MKKMPDSISTKVLTRYMGEDELAAFFVRYNDNLLRSAARGIAKPNENDMAIASHLRTVKSYQIVAKDLGISTSRIATAMTRVAVWGM